MISRSIVIFAIVSIFVASGAPPKVPLAVEPKEDCTLSTFGIYVCLSSQAEKSTEEVLRWVEVRWWGIDSFEEGGSIGVWDHDPTTDPDGMIESFPVSSIDGEVTTSLRFNGSAYPDEIQIGPICLPYWGGYIQNGTLVFASCLRLHPNWMFLNKESIETYGITEILLPGTHDAGSYDDNIDLINEIGKWAIAQDENFWQQSILGVRYFDMRVSHYKNTSEKFYVNHGQVQFRPLVSYLEDLSRFLNQTEEILIFDIHEFSHGFDAEGTVKQNLTILLESYFSEWMVPASMNPNPPLKDIWSLNKQIIVTYPEEETFSELIWGQNVHHVWGNVNSVEDLYDYMSTNIPEESFSGFLWSAMTELTPSTLDVSLNRWKNGLRDAAKETNADVSLWFRREWWNMTNIISMDFIASSDIISTVIEGNVRRFQCGIRPKTT